MLVHAGLSGFSILVGAHQVASYWTRVSERFEMTPGDFDLEADVFEIGAPAALNSSSLAEELSGVLPIESLGLDLDDADFIGSHFQDVYPDEFVADLERCFKNHGSARSEPLFGLNQCSFVIPLMAVLTVRKMEFGEFPNLVSAIGEGLHERVCGFLIVIPLFVQRILQPGGASQCNLEARFGEVGHGANCRA